MVRLPVGKLVPIATWICWLGGEKARASLITPHLAIELEELLGRKVDIASDGWIKPSVRESVYRDAVVL